MTDISRATRRPWVYDPACLANIYSDDATGSIIATCRGFYFAPRPSEEQEANAALIVLAVNNHEKLVAALREAILQVEYLHAKFQETGSGNAVLAQARAALDPSKETGE
jgi:hypothetical protein